MKRILIMSATVLVALILVTFGAWHFVITPSPQYSLYQVSRALQNHDYATFSRYVNVDDVISNAYDASVASATAKEASANTDPSLTQGFATLLKPTVVAMMKDGLKKQVEGGKLASTFHLPSLIAAYRQTTIQQSGKVATVTIAGTDTKHNSVKMRDQGGSWQIFDLGLDATTLAGNATSANESDTSANQKATFGQRMSLGYGWFLTIDAPSPYVSSDPYSQPADGKQWLTIQATYENTSTTANTYSLSNLQLKDAQGHSFTPTYFGGRQPALTGDTVEAQGKATGYVTFEVPTGTAASSVVYANGSLTIVFTQ